MIQRNHHLQQIKDAFEMHSICAILGPRQCGKTTLAKQYCRDIKDVHFFDLENPQDLSALNAPSITLSKLSGFIVIDEIQRRPNLFAYLRFLVDNFGQCLSRVDSTK
jgi:predicted AAA+ superfamily ATPase